ncbi:hypothetical protein QCA50_008868 [Cerrena zonata]|uniref:DUF6533 domain-containing protein n=1 Tax=Cerrena zonata TaxID=2478898 RepID=A0AAW0G1N0_9APHY
MSSFAHSALIKQNVTYLDLVAAAVLAYDYCLTFPREVKYVWNSHISLGKVLFFLTRYPVFEETALVLYHQFAVMSPEKCDVIFKTIGYQLGTWYIYCREHPCHAHLVCFWIPVFFFLQESLNSLVFTTPPEPDLAGCFLKTQKNILFIVFIIISSFETLILVLTLIRFAPHARYQKTSLIKVIYRDGIMNYFYLCILSICNVVVLLTAPRGYTTLLSALQRVMHSILSTRVLLHMREAAANPNGFTSQQVSTFGAAPSSQARFEGPASFFMAPEDVGYPMHDLRGLRSSRQPPVRQRREMSPFKDDEDDDRESYER